MRLKLFAIVLFAISLVACSSQDDSQAPPTDTASLEAEQAAPEKGEEGANVPTGELSREELRALARNPEAMQAIMADPERRQVMRERLKKLRQEGRGDGDPSGRRAAMRERAERYRQSQSLAEDESAPQAGDRERRRPERSERWWQNDVIARNVGLSEQQRADIDAAYEQVVAAARDSRQQLAEAVSAVPDALKSADRERLAGLADARYEALEEKARAEAEWMERLLDILDDDQMNKLVEKRPELLGVLLAPVR